MEGAKSFLEIESWKTDFQNSIKHIVLQMLFIITSPFLFILWLFCYLYRCLLIQYTKSFKENYGEILNNYGINLKDDFNSPHKLSITFCLSIDGSLTLERVTQLYKSNVIEAKLQDKLRYPELAQYIVNFGGYWFWKSDLSFDIRNHIHEWKSCSHQGTQGIAQLHQNILNRKWDQTKSPWELILVQTTKDTKNPSCLLFLRMHHCMADARSIIKLLVECLAKKDLNAALPNLIKKGFWESTFESLLIPMHGVRIISKVFKIIDEAKSHPWNALNTSQNKALCTKTWVALTPTISMPILKAIAKNQNVFPSSVIMSIVSGAVGSILKGDKQLPFTYNLAKPNHPPTLANHLLPSFVDLPVMKLSPNCRLQLCNKEHLRIKTNLTAKCMDTTYNIVGCIPMGVGQFLIQSESFFVVGITNISVEEEGFSVDASPCSHVSCSIGLNMGSTGKR